MKTLYITDLDGTLLTPDIKVSDKSTEIINRLIDAGLLFSVATARSQGSIKGLLDRINMKLPVVLLNGVFLYDIKEKKALSYFPLSDEAANAILGVFASHDKCPFMYLLDEIGLDIIFTELRLDVHRNFYNKRRALFDYRFHSVEKYEIPAGSKTVYFNLLDLYDELVPIYEKLIKIDGVSCAFYSDNYSQYWFLEVYSSDASKSNGALMLKKLYNIDKIVAFGDNFNDMMLFEAADESYAVGNAVPQLKQIATGVIGSNLEDGVAEFMLNRYNNGKL